MPVANVSWALWEAVLEVTQLEMVSQWRFLTENMAQGGWVRENQSWELVSLGLKGLCDDRYGCVVLSAGDSKRMLMGEISFSRSSGLGVPRSFFEAG